MKKLLGILLVLVVLAFIFADSLFYLAGRWQEKTGRIKRAVRTYSRLIKRYPRSRWAAGAKKAIERMEKSRSRRKRGKAEMGGHATTSYIGVLGRTKERVKGIEEERKKEYKNWLEETGE
ncbi:MAG: tetratricopeptide repeat protein [Nitrospirae bacterium]|nr:tetratricopeptide repeat protein [Nitrospirota bacterium]